MVVLYTTDHEEPTGLSTHDTEINTAATRLLGPDPVHFHAMIREAALRQEIGGPGVMRAQLEHLLELAELPNVWLQVLPFRVGAHPCVVGPFCIVSFAESGAIDAVYRDVYGGGVWVENELESAQFSAYFDRTSRLSLAPHDSAVLVDSIRKGM